MARSPAGLISVKRDGGEHSDAEIHTLISDFQAGAFTDYQMTAWLMAVYLNGLSTAEMLALTLAMLHSGRVLPVPRHGPPRMDKHSTGGVGDKISLPLAAVAAACGLHVPMISGRGLGHTGGTLDKLESIPGYNTQLSRAQFEKTVKLAGASIIGQTRDIAPADRRIYSLRDVTGTVACRPLIVASILSKKLAEGLHGLVLDVKVGRGAFMKDEKSARLLARSLVTVARELGTPAVARLGRMDAPLGRTIGNALEVVEAIEILRGEGPVDTQEITLTLAEEMLLLAGLQPSRAAARQAALQSLSSGSALERFRKMIELHGGEPRVVDKPSLLPRAKLKLRVLATTSGFVRSVDALQLAELALDLGAGRRRAADRVDHAVGIEVHAREGDAVAAGQLLCTLHAQNRSVQNQERALAAFVIGKQKAPAPSLFLGKPIR